MHIRFEKYQGTGNDFVMLDNLDGKYDALTIEQISTLCDRRFGIGADGLIKINKVTGFDFEVDYYNSDGSKSFCGNGARCAVAFAETLGIDVHNTYFTAIDGPHSATKQGRIVALDMLPVAKLEKSGNDFVLNTGSPHFVRYTNELEKEDVISVGKAIRYSDAFKVEGINVNLVQEEEGGSLRVLTYERGVEDETLSCGTGVTACALTYGFLHNKFGQNSVPVSLKGGELRVDFVYNEDGSFSSIKLIGPAVFVFKGEIHV
jgi:diaminopimelate epimerase